jgi:hypothetical protein
VHTALIKANGLKLHRFLSFTIIKLEKTGLVSRTGGRLTEKALIYQIITGEG